MKQSQFYYLLRRGLFMGGGGIWAKYVNDFKARVIADGGTMESPSCAKTDVKFLVENPEPVPTPAFTGLLNDYSGAAAAYSLRLLDNTYTGDAIVVRRASDNTTQSIGFVNNELDTASLESFCSGTDGFVTTWYDQSGNSINATNSNASSQPKIVSSGSTILENGKPAISFVGIQAYLSTSGYIFEFSQNEVSAHIVKSASNNTDADQYMFSEQDATPYSSQFIIGDTATGNAIIWFNATTIGTMTSGQGLVGIDKNSSGLVSAYMNGSLSAAQSPTINVEQGNTTAFGSRADFINSFYEGLLQEVITYKSDNSANRTGIETNINDFYSIY